MNRACIFLKVSNSYKSSTIHVKVILFLRAGEDNTSIEVKLCCTLLYFIFNKWSVCFYSANTKKKTIGIKRVSCAEYRARDEHPRYCEWSPERCQRGVLRRGNQPEKEVSREESLRYARARTRKRAYARKRRRRTTDERRKIPSSASLGLE